MSLENVARRVTELEIKLDGLCRGMALLAYWLEDESLGNEWREAVELRERCWPLDLNAFIDDGDDPRDNTNTVQLDAGPSQGREAFKGDLGRPKPA